MLATSRPPAPPGTARRAVTGSFVGTAIEWYDFFVYGTAAALVLGPQFFPSDSEVAGTLAAFATLAVGFVARPIGGAVLMATEHAPRGKAGLYGAAPQLGVPAGVILANLVFLVCTSAMSDDQFMAWGWRVPFLLSFVLVGVAMWIRLGVMESPAFRALESRSTVTKVPLWEVITTSWRTVLLAGGTFVATNGIAYVYMVYMLNYGTTELGFDRTTMLSLLIGSCPVWMLGMAISAYVSDIVGRRRVYAAAIGLIVVATWLYAEFGTTAAITAYFLAVGVLSLACTVMLLRGSPLRDLAGTAVDAGPVSAPSEAGGRR